jgi:hypothetical protein
MMQWVTKTSAKSAGGAGGGAMLIASAGQILVAGTIRANGGNCGGGVTGGGSGGGIRLVAETLAGNGVVQALGGLGAVAGGVGRIRIERGTNTFMFLLVPYPVVVRFALPEGIARPPQNLVRFTRREPFPTMKHLTQSSALDLDWTAYDEVGQKDVVAYRVYLGPTYYDDVTALSPFMYVPAETNFTAGLGAPEHEYASGVAVQRHGDERAGTEPVLPGIDTVIGN